MLAFRYIFLKQLSCLWLICSFIFILTYFKLLLTSRYFKPSKITFRSFKAFLHFKVHNATTRCRRWYTELHSDVFCNAIATINMAAGKWHLSGLNQDQLHSLKLLYVSSHLMKWGTEKRLVLVAKKCACRQIWSGVFLCVIICLGWSDKRQNMRKSRDKRNPVDCEHFFISI